ncbi:unnamed protein product [Dibothriocephalus latus]|uniref:Reverse transcriptase domain-containing protein n=1 Tax=Dibothriocephalus latus TaxID=60516 RepID=A0A3P7P016_DIBLA|nr:unnamed protein product [Dibothriocephalus latus]
MREALGAPELKPTAVRAWASNHTQMLFEGVFQETIAFEERARLSDIYVSKSDADLLGNKTISQLGLWNRPFQEICYALSVDEAAQVMLTIKTHKVLFKYPRLNYGVKTTPSIFQQLMDTMLTNFPGTVAYLDDILVVVRTNEELLERFNKVMENLIDYGLTINMEMSQFLRKEIRYLSFVVSEAGRSPDPERVAEFKNMKVYEYEGVLSYCCPLLPNM